MTLGQRLHQLRKAKGTTQEHAAEAIGVSRILYSHYERDVATPPIWNILKIAAYLEISVEKLMNDVEPVKAGAA